MAFGNLGIGTAASSTRETIALFSADKQLRRRFSLHSIPRLARDANLRRTLLTIERSLPLRLPSGPSEKESAQTLYAMSNGTIGGLWKLIRRAAVAAVESEGVASDPVATFALGRRHSTATLPAARFAERLQGSLFRQPAYSRPKDRQSLTSWQCPRSVARRMERPEVARHRDRRHLFRSL